MWLLVMWEWSSHLPHTMHASWLFICHFVTSTHKNSVIIAEKHVIWNELIWQKYVTITWQFLLCTICRNMKVRGYYYPINQLDIYFLTVREYWLDIHASAYSSGKVLTSIWARNIDAMNDVLLPNWLNSQSGQGILTRR